MGKNFYYSPLAIFFCLIAIDIASGEPVEMVKTNKNVSRYTQTAALAPAEIQPDKAPIETDVYLSYLHNPNEGSMTEIYRSLSEGSGYALIVTIPATQTEYIDPDLKPRTDYFYKVRAVDDGQFSEFSEPVRYTTFSNNYNPTLSARAHNDDIIELTFTDNSYNDSEYLIEGVPHPENDFSQTVVMTDSGRTISFFIYEATPGTTYNYTVYMWTQDEQQHDNVATATVTTPELKTPSMAPDKIGEETDIWVSFIHNSNEGSMTEIYRSLSEASGYTLIATIPATEWEYLDQDLKPRTDYFYKLRAVKDGQFSFFSESYRFITFSKNFNPDLSARAIDENTVELTFTDNSYNDFDYLIYDEPNGISKTLVMSDSGRTETFTHEAIPGTTYNYSVIMWTHDEQQHNYVASATATTPGTTCTASGSILREYWSGVQGSSVSQIPVNSPPTGTEQLSILEGPTNNGIHYGARIRGYICAPLSGLYRFWIASNDNSELWLSTDNNPANKVRIASVSGATNPRQWTKYPTQQSVSIQLLQGNRYYIEVLHKQGVGSDNVAVGWQLANGTFERPIPGNRLSPFSEESATGPMVNITNPADGEEFESPETIDIEAIATDDGTITKVEFYAGSEKLGEDLTAPYSFAWSADEGMYSLTAKATDNDGHTTTSSPVNINVYSNCIASGTITREYWAGVQGSTVSEIPVERTPTSTSELTIFEGPSNIGIHYGSRISGYICPPMTGPYYFYIASNDHSELWLSTDQDPANKQRIAYVTGATGIRQWNKYASQQSAAIMLTIGQTYYIEALHKQGVGSDNIAVGWQLPDGTMERPVPGNRLSPFEQQQSIMAMQTMDDDTEASDKYLKLAIYPNPTERGQHLKISGFAEITENVETSVEIMNMTGDVIYSERILCGGNCADYPVNIGRELPPGVYVVNLTTNGWRNTKRLLVK